MYFIKIAFARSLDKFVQTGKTTVKMEDLSEEFFKLYLDRLDNGMPQLDIPGKTTVIEQLVNRYKLGNVS